MGDFSIALEQCIMQKGKSATAGSKILENFIAPYDAEIVTRLERKNVQIPIRTEMDEFGIGRTFSKEEILSPSIEAVANGKANFALCNDVFGMQRRQAPASGLSYIYPSYGTVSRYGLIPLASSMDQIGIVCKNAAEGFRLLSNFSGSDPKDGAMYAEKSYTYVRQNRPLKIGIPSTIVSRTNEGMQNAITQFGKKFESVNIELNYFDLFKQVLHILAYAEISNNINRYDGMKFGYRTKEYKNIADIYLKSRTEGFGLDAKLAAIMGTIVLSREQYLPYYEQAMKLRRLIQESLQFDQYDLIVLPLWISENLYENSSLFALSPLVGLPSISFAHQGHGIQLIANARFENALLTAWEVARS